LPDDDRVIVFTGSNTFANEPEMRELYLAVALLNQRGIPTSLVRTGFNSPRFLDGLAPDVKRHVIDLGFIEKAKLPRLLALADVLVQPGHAGPFNDYRLPSKLPEFLASGRAVALPPTNLAALMQNGREAVFLPTGTPAEIADTCERLFQDEALRARLGANAVVFAREHFDLATNTRGLEGFYADTLARPSATDWSLAASATNSDATLFAANLASQLTRPPPPSRIPTPGNSPPEPTCSPESCVSSSKASNSPPAIGSTSSRLSATPCSTSSRLSATPCSTAKSSRSSTRRTSRICSPPRANTLPDSSSPAP
jgi:hypothetical protein